MQASAHILLLFLALLLESYLRVQHRKRQQAGFLAFYWSTRGLLSIPSRVTAVGQVSPATYAILSDNTGKYASWTVSKALTPCPCPITITIKLYELHVGELPVLNRVW